MTPLPPIGEARLNRTLRNHQLHITQAQSVARACREAQDTKTYKTTAAGDERKLRGIPAIGRGVTGAIPGTTPHAHR